MNSSSTPAITIVATLSALVPALAFGSAPTVASPWSQELGSQEAADVEPLRTRDGSAQLRPTTEARLPVASPTGVMEPGERQQTASETAVLNESTGVGSVSPDLTIDRERIYINEHEGATWVRGATYKARVAADGFTYIPFLGSAAPRGFPVEFQLESAEIGGLALPLTKDASIARQGDRFVLDRGPVEVIYNLNPRQVEQSFSVDPKGAEGDLVLTLEVTTDLAAAPDGAGFRFDGPHGGMTYGAATVFDGSGRSAHVPARLNGSSLALTVPAAFLAAASGPIVVDPIFLTYSIDTSPGFQRRADVAYDRSTDSFIYVYEDQFTGTDVDIFSFVVSTNGSSVLASGYVESSNEDWTQPSVGTVNSTDTALVAATRNDPGAGTISVVGRLFDFSTLTYDTGFIQISSSTVAAERKDPDVGGNPNASGGFRFLVVWEADFSVDSDIQWCTVNPVGNVSAISNATGSLSHDSFLPAVSKSSGELGVYDAWNIGFVNREIANNEYTLQALRVGSDGTQIDGPVIIQTFPIGVSVGELDVSDSISPIDALQPVFAMVYDQFSTIDEDTFVTFVGSSSTSMVRRNTVELQRSEHANLSLDQGGAAVATTRNEFVVSYLETEGSSVNVYATAFDFTEYAFLSISERRVFLGDVSIPGVVGLTTRGPGMASRSSGGNFTSRYVAVAREDGDFDTPNIRSTIYFASNEYSPAFQYCYGNPNSTGDRGFIRMEGNRNTTDTKRLVASALPFNAFGYFLVSGSMGVVANPNGSSGDICVSGASVGRYSNFVASSGTSGVIDLTFDPTSISQPTGAVTGMIGQIWNFQLWHRDNDGGALTSNFTNACSIFLN